MNATSHRHITVPKWVIESDRWVASQFKLWGAIRQCRWVHWGSAISEFSLTLVFALLPIYIPLIALPMFGHDYTAPWPVLHDQIKNGELYLLSTALLTPLYYFTFPQSRGTAQVIRPFPSQQFLILIFIGTISISVLAIAATKVQAAGAGIPSEMISISIWLFLFCCLTFLLSLAVRNSLPELAERSYDEESRREQTEIPPPAPPPSPGDAVDPDEMVRAVLEEHSIVQEPRA